MVTGVETTGLVLAILPLLVNQIDGYVRGLEKIRSLRRYRRELMRYSTGLGAQYAILLNTLELSLEGVVDNHDERLELISNPKGPGWASTQFQEKLRGRLGRDYHVFISTATELSDMLEELSRKLDLGKVDKLNTESLDIAQGIKFRMIFSRPVYDDLLSKIDSTNQVLKTLSEQSYQRSVQTQSEGPRRWRKGLARYQSARRHAKALYNAVVQGQCWKCACRDEHSVHFQLNPNPVRNQTEFHEDEEGMTSVENAKFTMMISSKKSKEITNYRNTFWYEVETESCPESCSLLDSMITDSFHSTENIFPAKDRKARVRFTAVASEVDCISSPKVKDIFSLALPIYDLCSTLGGFDMVNSNSGLIGYIPDSYEGTRYNMRIIRDLVQIQSQSLHDIILVSSLNQSLDCLELSRRDRLFLATILASSVLQFHGTWLREQWNSHDIKFPRNDGQKHAVFDHPYLSWKVLGPSARSEWNDLSSSCTRLGSGHIKNDILFPLAIALIELSLSQTISALYKPEDSNATDDLTRLKTATRVLPKVYRESGSNYGDVVKDCLYWSSSKGMKFGDQRFEESIFNFVVFPLIKDFKYFEGVSCVD